MNHPQSSLPADPSSPPTREKRKTPLGGKNWHFPPKRAAQLLLQAEKILKHMLTFAQPADVLLSALFRGNRQLGQMDRALIAESAFAVLRRKRSLEWRCGRDLGQAVTPRRLLLLAIADQSLIERGVLDAAISEPERLWLKKLPAADDAAMLAAMPAAVALDLPDWLYEKLLAERGEAVTHLLAAALNQSAPLDLRCNTLKQNRDALLKALQESGVRGEATPYSPIGIRLHGKPALQKNPLFLAGAFEVQDEGSQLLGLLAEATRGQMVADFCAGAGGKTLLLGAQMRSCGRLYAFDVADKRLAKLKKRVARAGLSNVQTWRLEHENDPRLKRLRGKFDSVLVDAPCSGLGTVRRNPDLKWRQTPETVNELLQRQMSILQSAAKLVRPGGRLIYATCSLLDSENQAQAQAFLQQNPDFTIVPAKAVLDRLDISLPEQETFLCLDPHGLHTDGFFAAVFQRQG